MAQKMRVMFTPFPPPVQFLLCSPSLAVYCVHVCCLLSFPLTYCNMAVNRQINDKERIAAALENPYLKPLVEGTTTHLPHSPESRERCMVSHISLGMVTVGRAESREQQRGTYVSRKRRVDIMILEPRRKGRKWEL